MPSDSNHVLPVEICKTATDAYLTYRLRCFWSYRDDFVVESIDDLLFVVKGLKTFGGRAGFMLAATLCHSANIK